jgi:hypothetical protein
MALKTPQAATKVDSSTKLVTSLFIYRNQPINTPIRPGSEVAFANSQAKAVATVWIDMHFSGNIIVF